MEGASMIEMTKKLKDLMNELKKNHAETFYHCLHVKNLTYKILCQTNLAGVTAFGDDEICHICKGALLHDIGKLFIKNATLTKSSALQASEMDDMKLHARLGAEAVEGELTGYEREIVSSVCRYHHERIDGSGYEGVTDVPIYVQAVSICDVFDALHSDRIYRDGLPPEKIFDMIRMDKCGRFDETLLNCLVKAVGDSDQRRELCAL